MKVRAVDAPNGFGIYEVSHPAADRRTAKYRVEIRSLDEPIKSVEADGYCDAVISASRLLGL